MTGTERVLHRYLPAACLHSLDELDDCNPGAANTIRCLITYLHLRSPLMFSMPFLHEA